MREILFRGKRTDNGEWVYGWYCRYPFGKWPLKDAIIPSEEDENGSHRFVEVDPSTVGQYTGLRDKNGKRIFEGDVLDMSILGPDHSLKAVSIEHGAVGFFPLHPEEEAEEDRRWRSFWQDDEQESWDSEYFTVIGNIHDPELLEGGGENG